jgi:hypothetical protein
LKRCRRPSRVRRVDVLQLAVVEPSAIEVAHGWQTDGWILVPTYDTARVQGHCPGTQRRSICGTARHHCLERTPATKHSQYAPSLRRTVAETQTRSTETQRDTERHAQTHGQSHTHLYQYKNTGHTDTQTHGHTDTRTHGHTDTRTHGHTDTRTHGHTDLRLRGA